ncbi:MAG: chitobiase/beta-hexosaminidase C-terminal domain-containing protein [Lachnospiraceae bacterium]|nr:chitobiase/beta-hexosaminidase C-terminal domain-containing protein [Lachnospiraceae bacterium]MDE6185016.1 chitobiase/beta-hexosaminidase C-terminal domain-containing protein [Lachnospiraceae bacterium]
MKCPNCGCEMAEDHLYCEKCGMEIQMVPDFEPEFENSIIETLSTVAEEIEGNSQVLEMANKENEVRIKKDRKKKSPSFLSKERGKNWLLASLITFIVVTVAAAYVIVFMYHRFSVTYQIEQARKYAEMQEFEEAISYLERARQLKDDSADIVLMESNYYYQMGEKQMAADILIQLVERGKLEYEDKERAYESIIYIYDEEGRYQEINSLLISCGDADIMNHFQQYMAMTPEFGYESGNYDKVITLKITANTTGKIYYTLDGSNPDEESEVYKSPLFLESGEYQVAAVFVNDYGIKSEIARSWYIINLIAPDPPEVLLYSGTYHMPTKIEVIIPEEGTVYYTIDGSNPTKDSLKYTEPIQVPLGKTNFKFVTISEEGVSSEIISRSYDFSFETDVTIEKAVENVKQALLERKVLLDLQGHAHGIEGKYVFNYVTIEKISDLGYYYVLNECIEDVSGTRQMTDRLYAVDVYTGVPNRLIYDENGQMGLISLQ